LEVFHQQQKVAAVNQLRYPSPRKRWRSGPPDLLWFFIQFISETLQ